MLTDVTPDMQIMQEEIFAPIVPVVTYKALDEVIGHISGRGKPLALYLYSNNRHHIDRVLERTSSGGVTINGFFSHYLENRLPFGGVNQSGMGSYHGVFGFKAFSHERAIYIQESRTGAVTRAARRSPQSPGGWRVSRPHIPRNPTVTGTRAALTAGRNPPMTPMPSAQTSPTSASSGVTASSKLLPRDSPSSR